MKTALAAGIVALLLCGGAFGDDKEKSQGIAWLRLKEGAAKSKKEKKPMLVDFYIDEKDKNGKYVCKRCETIDKTWQDAEIARTITENYIPVRIPLNKNCSEMTAQEKSLGEAFGYKEDCLLLALTPAAKAINGPDGKPLSSATASTMDEVKKFLEGAKKAK